MAKTKKKAAGVGSTAATGAIPKKNSNASLPKRQRKNKTKPSEAIRPTAGVEDDLETRTSKALDNVVKRESDYAASRDEYDAYDEVSTTPSGPAATRRTTTTPTGMKPYASFTPVSPFSLVPSPRHGHADPKHESENDRARGDRSSDADQKSKSGIIHLLQIPPGYSVSYLTMFFSQFGRVGHIYLKSDNKAKALSSKDNLVRAFTEGWIEFLCQSVAKSVAHRLNNTLIGDKKRSKAHCSLWSIDYLSSSPTWSELMDEIKAKEAKELQQKPVKAQQQKPEATTRRKRSADETKANQVERSKKSNDKQHVKKRRRDVTV